MQEFTHTVVTHVASLSRFSYRRSANPTRSGYWTTITIGPQLVKYLLFLVAEFFKKRAPRPIHHVDGRGGTTLRF
jgi:hypothetical protein